MFGLAVLLAGLTLPLTALVIEDEPTPFCCTKGRCCCPDERVGDDDRTCLRRGCGCEHRDEAVNGTPLQIEAVLPACDPPATAALAEARWAATDDLPIARADQPTVPPPRPSLPA